MLEISPKKLAIYLIIGPLISFLAHTIIAIVLRHNIENTALVLKYASSIPILLVVVIIGLWFSWLRKVVLLTGEENLRISKKWFRIAFAVVMLYIFYTLATFLIDYFEQFTSIDEKYLHIIRVSREFVSFMGIVIAYPIICHYAARGVFSKKNNRPTNFLDTLPYTLLLIFGTVLAIPFFHRYFSLKTSTNSQIIVVYVIGSALMALLFFMGLIAAITGLI